MATFSKKTYNIVKDIRIPSENADEFKQDVKQNLNKTSKEKAEISAAAAKQRIGKSVVKATIRTSALQVATKAISATVNHNIQMISLVEGNTYKQQIAQINYQYANTFLNAVRAGASAALISGNPVVGLAAGTVTLIGGAAGIGIDAYYANQTAQAQRGIDALNVSMARRALSVSSTYGNRNIQNKGVMY